MTVGACHAAPTCCKAVTEPLTALARAICFIERAGPGIWFVRPGDPPRPRNRGCLSCGVVNWMGTPIKHLDGCIVNDLRAEAARIDAWLAGEMAADAPTED